VAFQKKATSEGVKVRALFDGTSGSGKTVSVLRFAFGLAGPDGKVGAICSENGRILRYARRFTELYPEVMSPRDGFHPDRYIAKIDEAAVAGLDVLVIDSASHEWQGKGGIMEMVDTIARRTGGSSNAWRDVTPLHRKFVDAIIQAPMHILVTCRTKTEWAYDQVERNGRKVTIPRKMGTTIEQRPGFEYEFDLWFRLDSDHRAWTEKTNFDAIFPSRVDIELLTEAHGAALREWLGGIGEGALEALDAKREADAELAEETGEEHERAASTRGRTPQTTTAGSQTAPDPKPDQKADTPPDGSQIDQSDFKILPDGKKSVARLCAAKDTTKPGNVCGARMYPGTTETYNGQDFKASSLIARSLEKYGRVFCAEHFLAAEAHKKKQAPATAGA
jgi:hypothetical protein